MYSKMDFLDPIKKMEKCKYCTLLASFEQILNILCDLRKTLYISNCILLTLCMSVILQWILLWTRNGYLIL